MAPRVELASSVFTGKNLSFRTTLRSRTSVFPFHWPGNRGSGSTGDQPGSHSWKERIQVSIPPDLGLHTDQAHISVTRCCKALLPPISPARFSQEQMLPALLSLRDFLKPDTFLRENLCGCFSQREESIMMWWVKGSLVLSWSIFPSSSEKEGKAPEAEQPQVRVEPLLTSLLVWRSPFIEDSSS